MYQFDIDEARAKLPDLIEAAINGEEVYIAKNSNQMLQLVPVASPVVQPRKRKAGSAKGLFVMAEDFDAPLTDFEEYQ